MPMWSVQTNHQDILMTYDSDSERLTFLKETARSPE